MNRQSAGRFGVTLFWHAIDVLFYGAALFFLWTWFVEPTFRTAHITWSRAFGLVIFARLLVHNDHEQKDITIKSVVEEAVLPILMTEAGYLIFHFVTF